MIMKSHILQVEFMPEDKVVTYMEPHKKKLKHPLGFFHFAQWLDERKVPYKIKVIWPGIFKLHYYMLYKYALHKYNKGTLNIEGIFRNV